MNNEVLQNISQGMRFHPLREAFYEEMHSRPFQVIPSPARVTHLAILCDDTQRQEQFEHLKTLFTAFGVTPPEHDEVCIQYELGGLRVRREKHLEFTTYTFINFDVPADSDPFDVTGVAALPHAWLQSMPGEVITAFHLSVEASDSDDDVMLPRVKQFFEGMRLVGSSPQQGDARVWTTLRLHSDGFGRFLICNKRMSDSQLGRLAQRIMEIETYRLMALISLPLARECAPHLGAMDRQLAELTQHLSERDVINEKEVLSELTFIAARVEDYRAKTTFRFTATQAYHELVLQRLVELREDEVSGHLTVTEFLTRRLTPAVRTCQSVGERLEDMSKRIDRVSDMMRTRVELSIQAQNQQLLASMDRRSKIQLMMQHTVEGLSVAAISYYAVGLIKIMMEAAHDSGLHFNKNLALGIAVPVVISSVWLATRKIHKHFLKLAKEQREADLADEQVSKEVKK
ncbi:DUF3422 family protein [Neptunomonas antarctica]|uniref:Uncharacterized membrane-anchored protein n=1 Tax=Neptunomonas antarctica TaxID=619304 RepID=A0A1N7KF83_9GAMM|nr:DUF3422 domain-containing protein [Neptunomonas antarctica]SIS60251.1 Uncharacterized membrane-anchored protein [Neptunomonas antarctica]